MAYNLAYRMCWKSVLESKVEDGSEKILPGKDHGNKFYIIWFLTLSMVEFGTGYNMSMDREYGHHAHQHDQNDTQSSPANNSTNDVGVGIKDLGMSIAMGSVRDIPAVGAKLRAGMKTMEIGFVGRGKGSVPVAHAGIFR